METHKKRMIHGFWYRPEEEQQTPDEQIISLWHNLIAERKYYEHNDIDFAEERLYDLINIGFDLNFVLPTPFDWDGYAEKTLLQLSDNTSKS